MTLSMALLRGPAIAAQTEKLSLAIALSVPEGVTPILGDPMPINISVTNTSNEPVSFLTPTIERFSYPSIRFFIKAPADNEFVHVQSPVIHSGAQKVVPPLKYLSTTTVARDQGASFEFVISHDFPTVRTRRLLFPSPGIYLVKAQLDILQSVTPGERIAIENGLIPPLDSVETPTLAIQVREPKDAQDRQGWGDLTRLKYDLLLFAPDEYDPELHPDAEREISGFVQKHSTTHYGPVGHLFLAYSSFKRGKFHNDVQQLDKAIAHGEVLLSENSLAAAFKPKLTKLLQGASEARKALRK